MIMEMPWGVYGSLSWSSKANRSKKPSPPPEYSADEIAAAESLVFLANCGGGFCSAGINNPSSSTGTRNDDKNKSTLPNSLTIFDPRKHDHQSSHSAAHATSIAAKQHQETFSGDPTAADAAAEYSKKRKEPPSPDTPLPLPPYKINSLPECHVCGKIFNTHQALGGHMTSHRTALRITTASASASAAAANRISSVNPSGRLHECSQCDVVFANGQALGGHMRKHYQGPPPRNATNCYTNHFSGDSTRQSSHGGASSNVAVATSGLNIDLNLPPPPE